MLYQRFGFWPLVLLLISGAFGLLTATYYVFAQTSLTTFCGNGVCELNLGESSVLCPIDCAVTTSPGSCGDGTCSADRGETATSCPADCATTASRCNYNGACEPALGETAALCPNDCPASANSHCGNGTCDTSIGETYVSCPVDCPKPSSCGDGRCDAPTETTTSCPKDCVVVAPPPVVSGPVCGDGKCDSGESYVSCPVDCPKPSSCGDGTCSADRGETATSCPADCATTASRCNYNGACEPALGETTALCPNDCPASANSHCGNGTCDTSIGETYVSCPVDCPKPLACGDGRCDAPTETVTSCPKDCVVVAPPPVVSGPVCGDGKCDTVAGETNAICSKDCPPTTNASRCGDGKCDANVGESYTSCSSDCPRPASFCGDGRCDGSETTAGCSKDCPAQTTTSVVSQCGDGRCDANAGETAAACPGDCSKSPAAVSDVALPELCQLRGVTDLIKCRELLSGLLQTTTKSAASTTQSTVTPTGGAAGQTSDAAGLSRYLPSQCASLGISDPQRCYEMVKSNVVGDSATVKLPEECIASGLTSTAACESFLRQKSVSTICRNADIKTPEECRAFEVAAALPMPCQLAGAVDDAACRLIMEQDSLPETCRQSGLADRVGCQQLLERRYGRPAECDQLSADACWRLLTLRISGDAGTTSEVLPAACVAAGVLDGAACEADVLSKLVSEDCRSLGILTREACDRYRFESNHQSTTPTGEAVVSDDCRPAGITEIQACRTYLAAKYLPTECLKAGVNDGPTCQKLLAISRLSPACQAVGIDSTEVCREYLNKRLVEPACASQGITDAVACQEFLFGRLNDVTCRDLSPDQCATVVKRRQLGSVLEASQRLEQTAVAVREAASGGHLILSSGQPSAALVESVSLVPSAERQLRLVEMTGGIVIDTDQSVRAAANLGLAYDADGDGLPDDLERRLGYDPNRSDTDENGTDDLAEFRLGSRGAPVDRAIIAGRLEQPRLSGETDETLSVVLADVDQAPDAALSFSGSGRPGEVITLFIYSDTPLILTTEVDANGRWRYDLSDGLTDGAHEVYVAVNDADGRVERKSLPLSFVVREAQAISLGAAAASEAQAATSATINVESGSAMELYRRLFILGGALLTVLALAIGLSVVLRRSENPPLA